MIYKLQNFIFGSSPFGTSRTAYLKGKNFCFNPISNFIDIKKNGVLDFCTFYNSLSLSLIQGFLNFEKLLVQASFSGTFEFQLIHINSFGYEFIFSKKIVSSSDNIILFQYGKEDLLQLGPGLIFVRVLALTDGIFKTACFSVETNEIVSPIKLGICITHFNRQEYVKRFISKIHSLLDLEPFYRERIEITIVDNSKNLSLQEDFYRYVTIIPNENTGGTGGFMRGLLSFQEKKDITHVLFMDDDGSCEIETLRRTINYFLLGNKHNFALSSTLLFEERPDIVLEKGGFFDYQCHPRFAEMDITKKKSLIKMETHPVPINYGAWCYFAFPLSALKYYAFPYFVRGDDSLFSIMNKFTIVTPIGLASYATDFSLKVSSFSIYLDCRYHLINAFFTNASRINIICRYAKSYVAALLSFQYGRVECIRLAKNNVLDGGERFWSEGVNLAETRKKIKELTHGEEPHPIDFSHSHFQIPSKFPISIWRKALCIITLNGILLPSKDICVLQDDSWRARFKEVFRAKEILFFNRISQKGYITYLDRRLIVKYGFILVWDCLLLFFRLKKTKKEYLNFVNNFTTAEFWKKRLCTKNIIKL